MKSKYILTFSYTFCFVGFAALDTMEPLHATTNGRPNTSAIYRHSSEDESGYGSRKFNTPVAPLSPEALLAPETPDSSSSLFRESESEIDKAPLSLSVIPSSLPYNQLAEVTLPLVSSEEGDDTSVPHVQIHMQQAQEEDKIIQDALALETQFSSDEIKQRTFKNIREFARWKRTLINFLKAHQKIKKSYLFEDWINIVRKDEDAYWMHKGQILQALVIAGYDRKTISGIARTSYGFEKKCREAVASITTEAQKWPTSSKIYRLLKNRDKLISNSRIFSALNNL